MKWMLFAASAAIAAGLWLPGPVTMSYAAQPAAPAETAASLPATGEDKITFDQYREWRLRFIERRQTQLAAQLAAAELQPRQRARSTRQRHITTGLPGSATPSATAASASGSTRWTQTMTASSIPRSEPLGTISSAPFSAGAGPPPPNPRTAPIASFVFFTLIVAWAYWIDWLRESIRSSRS